MKKLEDALEELQEEKKFQDAHWEKVVMDSSKNIHDHNIIEAAMTISNKTDKQILILQNQLETKKYWLTRNGPLFTHDECESIKNRLKSTKLALLDLVYNRKYS